MASISPSRGACVCWQRGLKAAGAGYEALWYSLVSLPVECGGGLERIAGWYEGQLTQTDHPLSAGVFHGATRGVRLP